MLCAMPVTARIDGLDELLGQQLSVISRGQLLDLGMKDNAMQWRARAGGPWQALLPGVYLGLTGAPNLLQKEMAALLYAGPASLVTGPLALMHHGLRSPLTLETVDVLVPTGRQRLRVAAEVDSYEWHLSPADADRTRKRHDRMGAAGIIPLHFSPRQIRRERAEVVRLIKDALDRGLQCPPLPIRTIPCAGSPGTSQ